ncbi:MAG: hypothetical protein AB7P33_14005 [Dehalococcoidia bacterium]
MTTSHLVGLETQSSQDLNNPAHSPEILAGATQRIGAYNRLKSWLRMPQGDAAAAALAFQQAVKTLPQAEQDQIAEAEADALRHGFSFVDFQKLKDLALRAIEDPFVAEGLDDDQQSAYFVASMLALSN